MQTMVKENWNRYAIQVKQTNAIKSLGFIVHFHFKQTKGMT